MEIRDQRKFSGPGMGFEDLQFGWVVQGEETGNFYYVAERHGGSPRKRLINLSKKCLQDMNSTDGRYNRVQAELHILAVEGEGTPSS